MAVTYKHAIQIRDMVRGNSNQFMMSARVVWRLYTTLCWESGSHNLEFGIRYVSMTNPSFILTCTVRK